MPAGSPTRTAGDRRNLELKVRIPADQFDGIRELALRLSGAAGEDLYQIDRYLTVPEGRLKLRTVEAANGDTHAELIAYRRPNAASSRWSAYHITPVGRDHADSLAQTLAHVLPVLVEVRKHRTVCISGSTRIHLDVVDGLGTFVELETVIEGQDDREASDEHQTIIAELGLDAFAPEAGSYSDLLLRHRVQNCHGRHPN